MDKEEKQIIDRAVNNALCFGTGFITTAREALELYGLVWTSEHERYIFDTYVDK